MIKRAATFQRFKRVSRSVLERRTQYFQGMNDRLLGGNEKASEVVLQDEEQGTGSTPRTLEEWERMCPLTTLPALPKRSPEYWTEPLTGIGVVAFLCLFGLNTYSRTKSVEPSGVCLGAHRVVVASVVVVIVSTIHILVGAAGVIRRSPAVCYPVPGVVLTRLQAAQTCSDLENIKSSPGSGSLDTYCVRCFLWRPPYSHHCHVCQRCVRIFDHHCNVLGRCIVRGNKLSFSALIAMFVPALISSFVVLLCP